MLYRLLLGFSTSAALASCVSYESTEAAQNTSIEPEAATTEPIPSWFTEGIEFLTRDGGRWIADNSAYQSDNEPYEAFGAEWSVDYAGSITGRLFGILNGQETDDFWRFRQYWHPGEGRAIVEQFGLGGAIGIGPVWKEGEDERVQQTFYGPTGNVSERGHTAVYPDENTYVTESFSIVDGEWTPNRIYTWKRDIHGS